MAHLAAQADGSEHGGRREAAWEAGSASGAPKREAGDGEATVSAEGDGASARSKRKIGWMGSYYIMCISHVLGVSLKNQLFEYTAIVLARDVASIGNGLLFSLNVVVSFFAGVIVSQLGCIWSQALGHCLMIVFVALLSVCVFVGAESSLQWPFYLVGVCLASLAQPVENTMMGPLVERTSQILAAETKDASVTAGSMRASLMATFTIIVSCTHIVVNSATGVLLSVLEDAGGPEFGVEVMFPTLSLVILLALAMMAFAREPPVADGKHAEKSLRREVGNMCCLWRDPRIWLLGFAPLCLGLSNAWKLVALSRSASAHLGQASVAYLLLIQSVGQIVLPKPISWLMPKTGADVWVGLGALNYLLMPVIYWLVPQLTGSWGISIWYAMMGVAWSIYDVVARSVVLDHFPKEQSSYAFATMNVQMFATQALMFFLGRKRSPGELAVLMIVTAVCMFPAYLAASWLKRRWDESAERPED